ncbi:MAG: hypothetical protein SFY68_11750 [Candidatus Sumerlaeia bacterium]|nr:hypothetical protein [Candidatus Sumerlaeia bacterium]
MQKLNSLFLLACGLVALWAPWPYLIAPKISPDLTVAGIYVGCVIFYLLICWWINSSKVLDNHKAADAERIKEVGRSYFYRDEQMKLIFLEALWPLLMLPALLVIWGISGLLGSSSEE